MAKIKGKWLLGMTVLILFLGVISFGLPQMFSGSNKPGVEYLIGMSHPNLSDETQIAAHTSMIEELARHPNARLIFTNAGGSTYKQIKDIDKLVNYGVDLLIITANDANILGPILNRVNERIPVMLLGKDIPYYSYRMFIGPDMLSVGEKAAEGLHQILGDKKASVVAVNGPIDDPVVMQIRKGFTDEINRNVKIKIEHNIYCDWLRTEAEENLQRLLRLGGEVDAVFAQNSTMAQGAINALQQEGLSIPVISVAGVLTDQLKQALREGRLEAVLYAPIGGKEAIDYAMRILHGEEGIPQKIIFRSILVTRENLGTLRLWDGREDGPMAEPYRIGYIESDLWKGSGISDMEGVLWIVGNLTNPSSVEQKDKEQKEMFENFLASGVDMVMFSPVFSYGWEELLLQAQREAVQVVLLGNPVKSSAQNLVYIGPDHENQGRIAAQHIIEDIYGKKAKIKILEITGNLDSLAAMQRSGGFRQITNGYSRIEIAEVFEGTMNPNRIQEMIVLAFKKHRQEINVVFLHADTWVPHTLSALEELGLEPGLDVHLIVANMGDSVYGIDKVGIQVISQSTYENQIRHLLVDSPKGDAKIEKVFLADRILQ
ncbi:substrate-binding domain-containing protein [Anaerotalea alkaliphila]|uniref:Substrate-binding domain-containing protein n=1 Tax=Anaerotalea alkaliphila TaxID=2662126 RepID=A0A7X5HWP3_9FIRM|nr:substrate-binding domain-containing protein [Anaerotalea alkaliphila]NDL68055.1 substrate-binding domain-containing protein [Anaerotalea alkaliphila]